MDQLPRTRTFIYSQKKTHSTQTYVYDFLDEKDSLSSKASILAILHHERQPCRQSRPLQRSLKTSTEVRTISHVNLLFFAIQHSDCNNATNKVYSTRDAADHHDSRQLCMSSQCRHQSKSKILWHTHSTCKFFQLQHCAISKPFLCSVPLRPPLTNTSNEQVANLPTSHRNNSRGQTWDTSHTCL